MKITVMLFLTITLMSCDKSADHAVNAKNDQEVVRHAHKSWHMTKGLDFDPVSLPSCNIDRVKNLKIGDRLDEVRTIVGHSAVPYYYQKEFSILHVTDSSESDYYWEVALRHGEGQTITDISFKKVIVNSSL